MAGNQTRRLSDPEAQWTAADSLPDGTGDAVGDNIRHAAGDNIRVGVGDNSRVVVDDAGRENNSNLEDTEHRALVSAAVLSDELDYASTATSENDARFIEYDPIELDKDLETRYIPKLSVRSWALWDWSVQPFSTIIITFVFVPLYLANNAFLDPRYLALPVNDPIRIHALDDLAASIGGWVTIAGIVSALLVPILGRQVQLSGYRKIRLAIANILLILTMLALFFLRPDYLSFTRGAALIALGLVLDTVANVSYNALLPSVSTPGNVGRVSRLGWGAGYLSGMLGLFIILILETTDWFGHLPELGLGRFRYIALACALWALLFGWPLYRFVPEPPSDQLSSADVKRLGLAQSYTSMFSTLVDAFNNSPNTFWFLVASAIYRDGLAGILTFGAILAVITFGFSAQMVLTFGVIAYFVVGITTLLFARSSGAWATRRIIIIALAVLLASGLLALMLHSLGTAVFWIFGLVLCVVLGLVQAASRTYLERLAPADHASEIFGLYAITGKAASFLSAALWTVFIAAFGATVWGLIGILLVIAVGLGVLVFLVHDGSDRGAVPAR